MRKEFGPNGCDEEVVRKDRVIKRMANLATNTAEYKSQHSAPNGTTPRVFCGSVNKVRA